MRKLITDFVFTTIFIGLVLSILTASFGAIISLILEFAGINIFINQVLLGSVFISIGFICLCYLYLIFIFVQYFFIRVRYHFIKKVLKK